MSQRNHSTSLVCLFIAALSCFVLCGLTIVHTPIASAQGPDVDYSKFLHSSPRHSSLACTSCHQRTDNAATPRFPGHSACTTCHIGQFTTPAIPMCKICHTETSGSRPPLRNFPTSFNENFNVKFDHSQHMIGAARPQNGCNACHGPINRGVALSIPANLSAHNGCYTCHTPSSKSATGREIGSCGVCHDQKPFRRSSDTARAFRLAFSHSDHGSKERLACADCHKLTAGAPQMKQVSSPTATQHFGNAGQNCSNCHNGKRTFGGDLGFKDCKRCHTGPTFKI
jgi:c(7)-type cytochrome triheme protein